MAAIANVANSDSFGTWLSVTNQTVVAVNQLVVGNVLGSNIALTVPAAFGVANASFAEANLAFLEANAAYNQSNTIYGVANTAQAAAVASFALGNTHTTQIAAAFAEANAAYAQGNTAYNQSNVIFGVANNTVPAFAAANTAQATGVAAFGTANTGVSTAVAAFAVANGAQVNAVAAFGVANTAESTAVAAFAKANTGGGLFMLDGGVLSGNTNLSANTAYLVDTSSWTNNALTLTIWTTPNTNDRLDITKIGTNILWINWNGANGKSSSATSSFVPEGYVHFVYSDNTQRGFIW